MTRSSPQPEDAVQASGLCAGTAVWLEWEREEQRLSGSSVVESVGPARVALLSPMRALETLVIPEGLIVRGYFSGKQGQHFKFATTSLGPDASGRLLYVRRPATIAPGDRRASFRLNMAYQPRELFRIVVDPEREAPDRLARSSTVVDLSEGGLCLSTRSTFAAGERLGITIDLPGGGTVTARLLVRSCDEPGAGMRNRRVHCSFVNLDDSTRDLLVRFVLRRQMELRARGQL